MTTTDPTPVRAVFCCAEHPFTGALCERVLCDGQHSADGDDWLTPTPTDPARRPR